MYITLSLWVHFSTIPNKISTVLSALAAAFLRGGRCHPQHRFIDCSWTSPVLSRGRNTLLLSLLDFLCKCNDPEMTARTKNATCEPYDVGDHWHNGTSPWLYQFRRLLSVRFRRPVEHLASRTKIGQSTWGNNTSNRELRLSYPKAFCPIMTQTYSFPSLVGWKQDWLGIVPFEHAIPMYAIARLERAF